MERKILAAANAEKQKYFLEPEFRELPESIQEEVRVICVLLAQKLNCTFLMGFDEAGELYFETVRREDDFDFDEIGAGLEIGALRRGKKARAGTLVCRIFYGGGAGDKGKAAEGEPINGVGGEKRNIPAVIFIKCAAGQS